MITWSFGFFLVGLITIFCPSIFKYLNWTFDFALFFKEHPEFIYPIGIVLMVIGISLSYFAFARKRGRVLIRQVSKNIIGEGNNKLNYSKFATFMSTNTINLGSTLLRNNCSIDSEVIKEELMKMRFVLNDMDTSRISYLGADYIPYIVQFGVLVGQGIKNVSLYHGFRNQKGESVRKLHRLFCFEKCRIKLTSKPITKKTEEVILAIESSYNMDFRHLPDHLKTLNMVTYSTSKIGTSAIRNMKEMQKITTVVIDEIEKLSKLYTKIHLFLSCSSDFCFNLGRDLSVKNLVPILVYDYSPKMKGNSRPWFVELETR